jgi:hypothetical protein
MTLLKSLLLFVALPAGALCASTYFLEEIRNSVSDYIPEAIVPPVGLFLFFCFGAAGAMFFGLLFVPEAILNEPGNRDELKGALGVSGARIVRMFCLFSLFWFVLTAYLIVDKAYG